MEKNPLLAHHSVHHFKDQNKKIFVNCDKILRVADPSRGEFSGKIIAISEKEKKNLNFFSQQNIFKLEIVVAKKIMLLKPS